MIPRAKISEAAQDQQLLPSTIQKDYVLGWLLVAISRHEALSKWVFKGGTCLKKCFFETYRFSEDLDFSIPVDQTISSDSIRSHLDEMATWAEEEVGLQFPRSNWKVEEYENKRGKTSYQVKIPFAGPIPFPRRSLQRVKFDLTQDEHLADGAKRRSIHHPYDDAPQPPAEVLCYSVEEVLAEKTRALVERNGRARDVYDVVHISRNFREEIDPVRTREIARAKFAFKGLDAPEVDRVLAAIDSDTLTANWEHQLKHQLPALPSVDVFIDELRDAVAWWLSPPEAAPLLESIPNARGEMRPRAMFPSLGVGSGASRIDTIRYAARNRLCALVTYSGVQRLVEPYSLRYPDTGNTNLYGWERERAGAISASMKCYTVAKIQNASVSNVSFAPRWVVEL